MLAEHLVANVVGVEWGRGVKSFAGLSIGPFSAEVFTPLEPACFGKLGGSVRVLVLAWGLVLGYVLPKRRAVTIEPSLKPLPGESHPLVLVLLPSPSGSAQNTFSQHFLFNPEGDAVVVSGVG